MTQPQPAAVSPGRPNRRWLSFSLRTLLIVLTIFGIWLGLCVNSAHRQQRAVAEIRKIGGWVQYDYEGSHALEEPGESDSWVPQFILSRTGVDLFHDVVEVNMYRNVNLEFGGEHKMDETDDIKLHLPALSRLKKVTLCHDQVTDECLAVVASLRNLQELYCIRSGDRVTDAGVAHLANLGGLTRLHLSGSNLTDESLRTIGQMRGLEFLRLEWSGFTNAGLVHLQELDSLRSVVFTSGLIDDTGLMHLERNTSLESLDVECTMATKEGVARLQKVLPSLKSVRP